MGLHVATHGYLFSDSLPPVGSTGFGNPGGVSMHRSWVARKSRLKNFPLVVVALERLCDNCNTTGVRHSRWMGRRN